MKNALPITLLILSCAAGVFYKCSTVSGSAADKWVQNTATPAAAGYTPAELAEIYPSH